MDSTMFKSFNSFSELSQKTANYSITVKLHGCGWFVPVTKSALKRVNKSMSKNNKPFTGTIDFSTTGNKYAQVTMN